MLQKVRFIKLFLFVIISFVIQSCRLNNSIGYSISTIYPTDNYVISDFVVTDPIFGAKAEPGFDNRSAFQAAIDSAYNNGGGVVYIPAGHYEFHSSDTGIKKVRVREGDKEFETDCEYEYVLSLPSGVQLRGDWANPSDYDSKVLGTVLEVRVGAGSFNHDKNIQSWWNDPQANNVLHTSYTNVSDRFIEMNDGTGVMNLSIWYPEQNIKDVKPYPWTLYQAGGDCASVENVTLVNSYNGFYSAPSELHYLKNTYITSLNKGVEIHVCTDIGRIEGVKISPEFWGKSGLLGSPSIDDIAMYTREHGYGFKMHRSDWEYISNLSISDFKVGMWIGREFGFSDAPNSQLYNVNVSRCKDGLYIEDVNPYGLLISNSIFDSLDDGNAVYFGKDFSTSVQFNGVTFEGKVYSNGKSGVVSFENCKFNNKNESSLYINSGNVILTQCDFLNLENHVYLGKRTQSLKSLNSGYNNILSVKKCNNKTNVEIINDSTYLFKPIPANIITDIKVYPRPYTNKVLRGDLPKASGYNNDIPKIDVSKKLQELLYDVKKNGGGTLYLPAGRYLVDSPITIPSGVELRGSWDVQHHTQSGGTALFTNYDGGIKGELGESLIQLEKNSGISGLTIAQLNIVSDGFSRDNPRKTPFLIQGKGPKVYVTNVTVSIGDKGVDLASYDTSGHYVDFFAGVLLRAGIWVGGSANNGFIRNMQFNPHYSIRLPKGGQGYPNVQMMSFVQSNCSALKFADIKNQTIFNNFVFGSVYGIHFLKDKKTGNNPGKITMIGHGSDGCTYSLFVENADENTNIVGINTELVNTNIRHEPIRSYVLMGDKPNTEKVNSKACLTLFNSSFWGSPVMGAIVNNGTLRIQQGNFVKSGYIGLNLYGGSAHVYSSYFAQPMIDDGSYVKLHDDACRIEMTNNFYKSRLNLAGNDYTKIYGTDNK